MEASDHDDRERTYWHSRRGMLELDLLLMPYAREIYPDLDASSRRDYRALLEREDSELWAWLVVGEGCEDPVLSRVVQRVREHGRRRSAT